MAGEWEEFEEKSSSRTRNAVIVGAVAALAFVAFIHFSRDEPKQPAAASAAAQRDTTELPSTVIAPSIANPPVTHYAIPAAPARESHVGIYECTVNGQRVVSDRPCGSGAQARTLVVEQPDPRDVAIAQQRLGQAEQQTLQQADRDIAAQSVSRRSGGMATAAQGNASACAEVDREIDQLNARMRQGYTSQEGEWLRAEWHRLQDLRHALRCGR